MKIYISGRQFGKTTMLVKKSAETGAIIVSATYPMIEHTKRIAYDLGLQIPEPITVTNFIQILANGGLGKTQKYLVDELQMMLFQMNVEAATVDLMPIGFLPYHETIDNPYELTVKEI